MRDDDEDDIIEDMIAYHIIMGDEKGRGRQSKGSGGCLSWVIFIIIIVLLIGYIGSCTSSEKTLTAVPDLPWPRGSACIRIY